MSKIAGFITGVAVGTVGALLLAPKSGKELRQDLAECLANNPLLSLEIEYVDEPLLEDLPNDEDKEEDIIIDMK